MSEPTERSQTLDRVAYSPTEFAAIFGWSRAHVYNLIRRGELRAAKIGGTPRISASEVERLRSLMDAGATSTTAAPS